MTSSNRTFWHPVLIRSLTQCLKETFVDGYYVDKVLERAFKMHKKWGSRDRRFMAETLYDMTRWWALLAFFDKQPFKIESESQFVRRWIYYEVWKHQNDPVKFAIQNFPEATKDLSLEQVQEAISSRPTHSSDALSFPPWLYEKFERDFGSQTDSVLKALNETAPVCLRTNTLKGERKTLEEALLTEGIATRRSSDQVGLILVERQNVFATKAFKAGLFEVQDIASQKVAPLLDPKPGERIADVCAGAGGKTLHLAALMKNKGTLLAGDISEKKLEQLKLRARRAGVSNLRIQIFENSKAVKRQAETFDGVLIDAPCSGTGVIRRNSDTKWKLSPEEIIRLEQIQAEILESYSRLLKKGGRLVYATCSLLSEENERQVEKFLSRHPDFFKDGEPLRTRPDQDSQDGFFAQKMVRR